MKFTWERNETPKFVNEMFNKELNNKVSLKSAKSFVCYQTNANYNNLLLWYTDMQSRNGILFDIVNEVDI